MLDNTESGQLAFSFADGEPWPVWRPIHYLGSKLRLVESIRRCIDDHASKEGAVCDLFAGSGTVSLALARDREVIASDIQEYSRVLCAAILLPQLSCDESTNRLITAAEQHRSSMENRLSPILELEDVAIDRALVRPELLCELVEHGAMVASLGRRTRIGRALEESASRIRGDDRRFTATRYFGGVYFSFRQAIYIDAVLNAIDEVAPAHKEVCLAALLSTASTIVNSVGKQFAQPIRPRNKDGEIKQSVVRQMKRDRMTNATSVFRSWLSKYGSVPKRRSNQVIHGDYREVLAGLSNVAIVYADPPYTRDHYSRFYHVLETLCLRDSPQISTTIRSRKNNAASRGVYRTGRHQSPFCIKSQAPGAFAELISRSKRLGVPLLISYSPFLKSGHPRLMTIEAIVALARANYRDVKVEQAKPISHSKLNRSDLHLSATDRAEVFIVCRP